MTGFVNPQHRRKSLSHQTPARLRVSVVRGRISRIKVVRPILQVKAERLVWPGV